MRAVDAERLVYETVKPGPGGSVSLMLTPLELIERLAALIPPPRRQAAEPPEAAIHWFGARWLLWVGCRPPTVTTQWPLENWSGQPGQEAPKIDHQCPDQSESCRPGFSGHRQCTTQTCRSSISKRPFAATTDGTEAAVRYAEALWAPERQV
ncbi:MAG: hypothetical protein IPH26_08380 [Sterolibacteriaceae bacterium]|uniref:Uncharacterized protein n=1 Tax=Candidatus Methylophosphatis roskildensis TaxID=2899263 RepID=A0A9D7E8B2_9PROT|nr:hypothetical protein [Candidatus Methylophosphatis roskildensis]MBK7237636.1 hypothetical protein [Sterolibacteriaceae bacterium]